MNLRPLLHIIILLFISQVSAQETFKKQFSRPDSLLGQQNPERTAYDINYYHLDIRINPGERYITGQNIFRFTAVRDFKRLQFDLFPNMHIESVLYNNKEIPFTRELTAVYIDFPEIVRKDTRREFTVVYSGKPIEATNAPWDGGFVFEKDAAGKPWVGVAAQGKGASIWWPNKDQQTDEVDSMMISISVPDTLVDISNGQYRGKEKLNDGYTRYNWFVSYPINNYNVTVNIGDYIQIKDSFLGKKGHLGLDYYVLKGNQKRAKKYFSKNVTEMLACFEDWFGPYPFYRDGYKLIESSYLGMEHQSAIAYGNRYENGYLGIDHSGTGYGKEWDFIIIHESAHEWFGNNITAKDIADSWIHESFATYAEACFVECRDGKKAASAYLKGLRNSIQNTRPMIGHYGVNDSGSSDVYYKGANILHTIRTALNDDKKWRTILRSLTAQFSLQTVTTKDIVSYINRKAGRDFTSIFNAYLYHASIPNLEFRLNGKTIEYRWVTAESEFDLPVRIRFENDYSWQLIYPNQRWQKLKTNRKFVIDTDNMYFDTSFDEGSIDMIR